MLILGLTAYLSADNANNDRDSAFNPIFDFFARYVRKVLSDRHIKNTLSSSPGMSFLDMIGPSDIAYVVTVLKNSKAAWLHDTADKTAAIPKPLFTRGESKKRVFGNTTMNKDGQDYFKEGVKNWKKVFDPTSTGFSNLKSEWEQWLKDEGSAVNTDTWRRKNICSLLAVRVQRNQGGGDGDEEESGGEGVNVIEWEYDSDGELGQALGSEQGASDEEDDESIGMGREDAFARQGGDDRQTSGRRPIEDDDDDDDDDRHEEDDEEEQEDEEEDNRKRNYSENDDDDSGEEEEDEEMNKKPAARPEPVIHNTRPQNKINKRTYDAVEEPTNIRKKNKRGPTSAKEKTTGGKKKRPVRNKSVK